MLNKIKFILSLAFVIFILKFTNAQVVKNYYAEYFISGSDTLPYRIYHPRQSIFHLRLMPLVIFLHGAGERGNDNLKQLTHVAHIFTDSATQAQYPAYVIAPQCGKGYRWVEVDWSADSHTTPKKISKYLGLTMQLVNQMIKKLPIDTRRIYVTGLSMGGFGTWDLLARYPEKFAAAAPVCGGGDLNAAHKMKNIPIWVFHGAKDRVVKVKRSRDMIKAIKKEGGNPRYTEYPKLGHFSWNEAYNEKDFLKWLFSQSKHRRQK